MFELGLCKLNDGGDADRKNLRRPTWPVAVVPKQNNIQVWFFSSQSICPVGNFSFIRNLYYLIQPIIRGNN